MREEYTTVSCSVQIKRDIVGSLCLLFTNFPEVFVRLSYVPCKP